MSPRLPVHDDPLTLILMLLVAAWPMLLVVAVAVAGAALLVRVLHRFGRGGMVVALVWVVVVVLMGYVETGKWVGEVGTYAAEYLYHCGRQQSWQIAQGMWAERTIDVSLYVQRQDRSMNACVEDWGWRD